MQVKIDYNFADRDYRGTVTLVGDGTVEDARQALLDADAEITQRCSDEYVSFCPYDVNDEEVGETGRKNNWVTDACLDHLSRHPDVRVFELEGSVD